MSSACSGSSSGTIAAAVAATPCTCAQRLGAPDRRSAASDRARVTTSVVIPPHASHRHANKHLSVRLPSVFANPGDDLPPDDPLAATPLADRGGAPSA